MPDDRKPPAHVAAAAEVVGRWLKGAPSGGANAQRLETAAERFARLPRADKPVPLPAWKDPRTA
jgi:hypothetical protein